MFYKGKIIKHMHLQKIIAIKKKSNNSKKNFFFF